jgi:predicted CXXCH cytochrome family protein
MKPDEVETETKQKIISWLRHHRRQTLLAAGAALAAVAAISCGTVSRSLLAPPQIPGAKFVGSETCADCHKEVVRDFKTATHQRLKAPGDNAKNIGCESCHGPGSLHNESGGARGTIINPRKSPETCFQCHQDKRATFSLPNHHPVLEGKVSCGDCHAPHKGDAVIGGGTQLMSQNETCGKCHTAQFGPFVFEHDALKEGCTTCHQPHGSVNEKMLVTRNSTLCLKCHFEQMPTSGSLNIGSGNHFSRLPRGSCWSAGCHEEVHGSQISRAFRY